MSNEINLHPPEDPDTGKGKTIKVTVTAEEHAEIVERARASGYRAVSKFVLAAALADGPDVSDDLARRIAECGELLHDIHHLAQQPGSPVKRAEVRRLIEVWESLCQQHLIFHDLS